MRCPSCGTENTPDSRFCGGCGARTTGVEAPRLAPTHKIADDARWDRQPQPVSRPTPQPAGFLSQPPQMPPPRVASTPPQPSPAIGSTPPPRQTLERASTDPTPAPISAPTPRPSAPPQPQPQPIAPIRTSVAPPDGSSVAATPRRGKGLIVAVLLIDLALAGVGGALLVQGLRFHANVERIDEHH